MSKPIVTIFINPGSQSTVMLDKFLANNIDQINEYLFVKRVKVTSSNAAELKRKGIDHTPTLIFNKKKFVSLDKIIKILTPPSKNRDHFGYGNTNPDDLILQYQSTVLDTGEEEDNENDPENRNNEIRQKMSMLQRQRAQLEVKNNGKKLKSNNNVKSKFDSDDDFRKASHIDDITETPSKKYMEEADGDMILEDYYLEIAQQSGKKVGKTVSRRK